MEVIISDKGTCTSEGCGNNGRRYIEGRYVCDTCRSRHYRKGKKACTLEGCHGFVKFGASRTRRYCRRHEQGYMSDRAEQTQATLEHLTRVVTIRNNGCWQYMEDWGALADRPTISSGGLKWLVLRWLYVWYYNGHEGHLELHHVCGNRWCVHPGHVTPVTGPRNRAIEHPLNEDDYLDVVLEAVDIGSAPIWPTDPAKAAGLDWFAAQLKRRPWTGSQMPIRTIEPVVIPAQPVPEPAPKPVKVDLFPDTRPPQDARVRRRRRTVARS